MKRILRAAVSPWLALALVFLAVTCGAIEAPSATATDTAPPAGTYPAPAGSGQPQWIDEAQFDRQLRVVHGRVPDANLGLFGPHSMMWRMNRFFTPAALGSGRALILQISHPWVTAGIDEHSITREHPLKRGRATFRYLLTMIYGSRDQALQAAHDVRTIHEKIQGDMPYDTAAFAQGSEYRANEVQAMIWVHATLWDTLMMMYEQSVGPVSDADKERFYQETKLMAYLFGIPDAALPQNWVEFEAYCENMRNSGALQATPASKDLQGFLFGVKGVGVFLWLPMQYEKVVTAATLPPDLRDAYGLGYGPVRKGIYRSTMAMSRFGHKVTPGFITKNPAHKEAIARIANKRASAWTRFQLWLVLGDSHLTDEL